MLSKIEGYCYHCSKCGWNRLNVEPVTEHSKLENGTHYVDRRLRSNCKYHIKLSDLL